MEELVAWAAQERKLAGSPKIGGEARPPFMAKSGLGQGAQALLARLNAKRQ
jgi:hypothetical protein